MSNTREQNHEGIVAAPAALLCWAFLSERSWAAACVEFIPNPHLLQGTAGILEASGDPVLHLATQGCLCSGASSLKLSKSAAWTCQRQQCRAHKALQLWTWSSMGLGHQKPLWNCPNSLQWLVMARAVWIFFSLLPLYFQNSNYIEFRLPNIVPQNNALVKFFFSLLISCTFFWVVSVTALACTEHVFSTASPAVTPTWSIF